MSCSSIGRAATAAEQEAAHCQWASPRKTGADSLIGVNFCYWVKASPRLRLSPIHEHTPQARLTALVYFALKSGEGSFSIEAASVRLNSSLRLRQHNAIAIAPKIKNAVRHLSQLCLFWS